jgi:hypothetical protein
MTSIVLAAAAVARIAVADFDADALSPRSGHEVAAAYAASLKEQGCTNSVVAPSELTSCRGEVACQAQVARRMGFDYLVRGRGRTTEPGSAVAIDLVTLQSDGVQHIDAELPAAASETCHAISRTPVVDIRLRSPASSPTLAGVTEGSLALPRAVLRVGAGGDTDTTEVRIPLRYVVLGSAALTGLLGIGLGGASAAIWGRDHPKTVNGVTYHTIPVGDAHAANSDAVGADVFFAFTGLLAITGGVMVLYRW